MRRALVFVVAVISILVPHSGRAAPSVRPDADWLLAVQTQEGIITMGIDRTWCVPYFASIGARGLAYAAAATGDARYTDAAWRWLSWYQARMDANGFVTDYRYQNGAWRSTGTMDSTDSYAATFLSAARDVYAVSQDRVRLNGLRNGIVKAAHAIELTTDYDGLTWAKPDYKMKYLMDNAEVYEGWVAAADLAIALGDTQLRSRAQSRASALLSRAGVYRNTAAGGYDWAIGQTGVHERLDWRQFYPSVTAQPWGIFAGLYEGDEARAVMQRLDQEFPAWDRPDAYGVIVDKPEPIGYWPAIALGFLRAGLPERAMLGYDRISAYAASQNRYWPFHPGAAGALLMIAADGAVRGEFTPPPAPEPSPTPTPSASPTPSATPAPTPTQSTPSPSPSSCVYVVRGICMLFDRL